MLAQLLGHSLLHGSGQVGVDGRLGEGAKAAQELGQAGDVGLGERAVAVGFEHVGGYQLDEAGGDAVRVAGQLAGVVEDGIEGDPGGDQLGAGVEQAGAGDAESVAALLGP